jgi:hypothetical protein
VLSFTIPLEEQQVDDTFGSEAHVRVPLEFAGEVLDVSKWLSEEREIQSSELNQSPIPQTTAGFTAPDQAETGKPMRVYFARNTVSSKGKAPAGMDFGQALEPTGEYMVVQDSDMSSQGGDGWAYGEITFRNPLVLEHKSTNSTGWKKDLSEMFGGKTGKALTNAVKKAGYDGIVTRDGYGYSEVVNLSGAKGGELNQPVPQTETEAFKRWFGGSKVVDAEGKPLVVYHGTNADFTEFQTRERQDKMGRTTGGGYFTADPDYASSYGSARGDTGGRNVMPVYLSLQNPLVITDADGSRYPEMTRLNVADLEAQGYDGVIYNDHSEGDRVDLAEVVAFRSTQIKSATGNRGTFDPNDPNILNQDDAAGPRAEP